MAVPAFFSCSVKESRTACPCYTSVAVEDFLLAGFSEAMVSFSADRLLFREKIALAEYEDGGYVVALDRKTNRAAVIAGMDKSVVKGDSLFTSYGLETDPIWLYSEKFVCDDDDYLIDARPHKQYCLMEIALTGISPSDACDCIFRVKAGSCGLDLYARRPLEGDYCAVARRNSTGNYSLRIPRQAENALLLELFFPGGGDTPVFTMNLGEEFGKAGYDWTREDLRDAAVEVDYSRATIRLSIQDWNRDDIFKDIKI